MHCSGAAGTHSLASAYVSRQNLTGIRLILKQLQLKGSVVEFAFSRDGIFQKSSGRLFTAEASPMMRIAAPQTRVRVVKLAYGDTVAERAYAPCN